jgi:hypothetical protein
MVTVRQFVGAILEELTKARAISDAASVRIANQYLAHPLLKGYPVPRMHLKDIEIEMNFAVAPGLTEISVFDNEDVRQNVRNQLRQMLQNLPQSGALKPHFDADPHLAERWNKTMGELDDRFERAMTRPGAGKADAINNLCLIVENAAFEVLATSGKETVLGQYFARLFEKREGAHQNPAITGDIRDQVTRIVECVDTLEAEAEGITDLLDLKVLVEARELEKVGHSAVQKMKLTFNSSDRKWIASEQNGQKTHTLARS